MPIIYMTLQCCWWVWGCGSIHVSHSKALPWFMRLYNIGTNYIYEENSLPRYDSYVIVSKLFTPHGASVCFFAKCMWPHRVIVKITRINITVRMTSINNFKREKCLAMGNTVQVLAVVPDWIPSHQSSHVEFPQCNSNVGTGTLGR